MSPTRTQATPYNLTFRGADGVGVGWGLTTCTAVGFLFAMTFSSGEYATLAY
jgi:hypothetical protein